MIGVALLGVPLAWFVQTVQLRRAAAYEQLRQAEAARAIAEEAERRQDFREAVANGRLDRVCALLESGVDVNTEYENGFTPIYFAADPVVVDLLISRGAALNIRDRASIQSPIEAAAEQYDRDPEKRETWKIIIAKMRDAGAAYTIDAATYMNDIPWVEKRLAADTSLVNETNGAQDIPLRLAARLGRVKICKLLLEHGADPDDSEQGCGFPIMVNAVEHPAVVKLLIDHGANLKRKITWRCGRTGVWVIGDEASALHYAAFAGN
jgi:ankyrin repeat protein